MLRTWVAAGLCAAIAVPASADTQAELVQALQRRLEANARVIESLAARIADLERKSAVAAAPTPPSSPVQTARTTPALTLPELQESVTQLAENMSRRNGDGGLALHGFADVGAAWSSRRDPSRLRGFNAGTLDLYLTPHFGGRVKGLAELVVKYGPDGGAAVDLERLQLGYTVSDAMTLWFGRFHTPYGLWNTAFHHGANLQTSISRPRFIEFEDKGGILPSHSVGVWASGKLALGAGKATYDAYLSNGPRIVQRTLDFGAFTDHDANKMLGVNLGYQAAGALNGLTLGVHGFGATAQAHDSAGAVLNHTRLRMAGAYFGYDEHDWEVLGEAYHFANRNLSNGVRHNSRLGFVQVGRTIAAWTPFVRIERSGLDPTDNYFRSQESGRSYRRSVLGVRVALDPKSSFKFELSDTQERATELLDDSGAVLPFAARSYRRAAFQYSVAF